MKKTGELLPCIPYTGCTNALLNDSPVRILIKHTRYASIRISLFQRDVKGLNHLKSN